MLSLLSSTAEFLSAARLLRLKSPRVNIAAMRSTGTATPTPIPAFEPVLNPLEAGSDGTGTSDSAGDEAPAVTVMVDPGDSVTDVEAIGDGDALVEDARDVFAIVPLSSASIVDRLAGGGALNVKSLGLLQETKPSAERPQHAHS